MCRQQLMPRTLLMTDVKTFEGMREKLQERCWGNSRVLTSLTVSFSLRLARSSCTPAASTAVLERALSCAEGFCGAALSHLRVALHTHSPQQQLLVRLATIHLSKANTERVTSLLIH